MPVGTLLLIAFLIIPVVEIALFIQIGGWIGLWPTLLLIVVTAVVGSTVIRAQGFGVLSRLQRRLDRGEAPLRELFDGVCLLIAGLLLLTPGFFTDAVGAVLLIPAARALAFEHLGRHLRGAVHIHGMAPPGDAPRDPRQGSKPGDGVRGDDTVIIDADYEEVDNSDMPPPRGDWDKPR